ncbi:hypothetical protein A2210_00085 [Candidatus Woesebacteria bacterium RIFOXYA1_FULL_40_18]|uniref:CYTH domain-containing protein n=1 Tax=Candidatus Woesebacteria bacterium RIFOXYA1_FULL_40_18 TaxID=1802532 RepID=A0A1F8CKM1_9BACT|nr:MAG: hypothetical protein A2210_00085 [Candidatus Woesebacteria bacterium RIFOXYA1_FULL_40_18]
MGKQKKNIEIEIRLWLKNPAPLIRWLKNNAALLKSSKQTDIYFDPPDKSYIFIDSQDSKDADEWFRLRTTNNENFICYKKWHRDKKTKVSLYADEIETRVVDNVNMLNILKKIGFKETAVVKKQRKSWKFKNFEFDCDRVQKLGYFVEIEYKGKVDNLKKDKEKIFLLLEKIGIKDWRVIDRGYPWMLWNPGRTGTP